MSATPELYLMMQGANVYAYTNAESNITYNGREYIAVAIGRGTLEVGDDINRADMSINVARDNPLAIKYFLQQNEFVTTVTIYQLNSATDVAVFWKGRVVSYKPSGDEVEFKCESVFTSLRRPGLRAKYQRGCRHTLYGPACGVNKETYAVAGNVEIDGGVTLQIPVLATKPDNYFTGGMIKLPDGSYRYVVSHNGNQLALQRISPSLSASLALGQTGVTLYPGCDRNRQTCINKFNNGENNGGFPWLPERNPYDGEALV